MAKGQDIAVPPRAFTRFLQQMSMTADVDSTEESTGSTESTVEKIVTAETEAEMWDADELGLIGGRNIVDVEMCVNSFLVRYSRKENNTTEHGEVMKSAFVDPSTKRGMYLLVESTRLDNGEEFTWNTSAPSVLSKLFWLHQNSRLPCECVIRGKDLGGGQMYLTLKPVPKRAVQ